MTLKEAHVAHRQALCARAFRALESTGSEWAPEMAPLTLQERAIVTSAVRKERETRASAA